MQKYGFDDARPGPRAGQRPRDGRPRGPRHGRACLPVAGLRDRGPEPRGQHRRRSRASRCRAAQPGRPRPDRREPRARLRRRVRAAGWSPRSTRPRRAGDTLGGIVEVLVYGLPPGLGSHVHWDRRIDAKLAAALMGIQAIKGVEIGDGFEAARQRGSEVMDEIVRGEDGLTRTSGRLGGTEGGMTSGEVLRDPGRDEADQHGAPGAAHDRRRDRRGQRRASPAQRRVRRTGCGCGRGGDGGAGASRMRPWRSSAATRSRRAGATARATSRRCTIR